MGELPTDRRPNLHHLLGRAEAVKTCHQRRVQARWHRQGRRWNRRNRVPGHALAFGLKHGLGHFLHKQGNAVGALDDVLSDIRWQQLIADDALDHGSDFTPCQPIDCHGRHVVLSDPRRVELRPKGHDQQHAKQGDPIHHPTERLQARGIDPMRVLQDHQYRTQPCQGFDLPKKRVERSLPTLLWREPERGITAIVRKRQHLGKKPACWDRHRACRGRRSHRFG
jgi:hypothetical protein